MIKYSSSFILFLFFFLVYHQFGISLTYGKVDNKKIAFLFLTRGSMRFEEIWREFFKWRADSRHYTIYLHMHGHDFSFKEDSVFFNREIANTVDVVWGNVSIAFAIRNLMAEALLDPLNEWFNVISESCLPVIPFNKWRNSLLKFDKSLLNACEPTEPVFELSKFSKSIYIDELAKVGIQKDHFRKTETWVSLKRKHAELFVHNSSHQDSAFSKVRSSAERFLPSFLSALGLGNETTCNSRFVYTNWPIRGPHPKLHTGDDINPQLFHMIRSPHPLNCSGVPGVCHFTARKFSESAKYPLLENLSMILSEDGHPYNRSPYDVIRANLRKNKEGTKYFIIENGLIRQIPDKETADYSYYNLSKASLLTDEDIAHYKYGAPLLSRSDGHMYASNRTGHIYILRNGSRHVVPSVHSIRSSNLSLDALRVVDHSEVERIPLISTLKSERREDSTANKKIAFLFFVNGKLHFEDTWRRFFSPKSDSKLWNIYAYNSGDQKLARFSFLRNHLVESSDPDNTINPNILQITRRLVFRALKDPLNKWFCVVREYAFPLVSFHKWRHAMLATENSMMDACPQRLVSENASAIALKYSQLGIPFTYVRKSSLSFAIVREHAELFALSVQLDDEWNQVGLDPEYFIPTLLALNSVDNTTTCTEGYDMSNLDSFNRSAISIDMNKQMKKDMDSNRISSPEFNFKCSGSMRLCHFLSKYGK